ncbi:hypothetical protein BDV97DRAFT_356147 [Delphinella strobiligena]|nr:hypothetical protein BDV97DRAFT_356147 [Delphinella strobiligena]
MRGSPSETFIEDHGRPSSLRKRAYNGDAALPRERPTPVRGEVHQAMPPPILPASRNLPLRHPGADQSSSSHPIRIQSAIPAIRPGSRQQFVDRHNHRHEYGPRAVERRNGFEQIVNNHDTPLMSGALPVRGLTGQNRLPGHESATFAPCHGSNVHDRLEERLFARPDIPTQIASSPSKHDRQGQYAYQGGHETPHIQEYRRPPSENTLRQQARIDYPSYYPHNEISQPHQPDQAADFHSSGILDSARQIYARRYTPSPQKCFMRQTDSVASPFFKPMTPLGPSGNLYSQRMLQNSMLQNAQPDHRMAPVQGTPMLAPIARSINGLSFINEPHSMTDHEPLYDSRDMGSYGYRPVSVAPPQTPRDGNGLFKRPGFTPELRPFSSQQFRRPQPLPSSQPSLAPEFYAAQSRSWPARNETLGLVKGAKRGGSSSSSGQRKGYSTRFGGILSGGGRRSVRR